MKPCLIVTLCGAINEKFFSQFGFHIRELSFPRILEYLHAPKDSSSLAFTRILFGLAMLFDIPDERGGANMEQRWGDPNTCHFPLFPFIQPIPMPYMALVYAALWLGAFGIMLGYKYRSSAITFTICYWYLFLIEKSFWNNHSYLFGLVTLLLTFTNADCYWSIDSYKNPSKLRSTVPYWNYFILKYQFFILYFMAGMKKGTAEWLTGYSVQNLSEHWVFAPFKLFLTVPQTDYLIVHWFVFVFDLTIALWMMYSKTRHVAMIFCAMFHLMNSRLFRIGMFPWVCLATMPLFYPFDWPKTLFANVKSYYKKVEAKINTLIKYRLMSKNSCDSKEKEKINDDFDEAKTSVDKETTNNYQTEESSDADDVFNDNAEVVGQSQEGTSANNEENKKMNFGHYDNFSKRLTLFLIIFHVLTQAFLPYSHFITKGYNNWTNGLYGYSWDMMVHTWDTHSVIIKIVDNEANSEFFLDPYAFTPNDRWTRQGDMVYQYARCLNENLMKEVESLNTFKRAISKNISIYFDVWCSMNGRFTQRHFDSKADLLKVDWSPFKSVSYLMPLLDEALSWRVELDKIRKHVHAWNNYSDVLFVAEFPGYKQNRFIPEYLENVTLTVLEGVVGYEPQDTKFKHEYSYKLTTGDRISVDIGISHSVLNTGNMPAFYMYSSCNKTEEIVSKDVSIQFKLPIITELLVRFNKMAEFGNILLRNLIQSVINLFKCH